MADVPSIDMPVGIQGTQVLVMYNRCCYRGLRAEGELCYNVRVEIDLWYHVKMYQWRWTFGTLLQYTAGDGPAGPCYNFYVEMDLRYHTTMFGWR